MLGSPICTAYRKFIESWSPENETENAVLKELGKGYKGAYFGFALSESSGYLEQDPQLIEKYQSLAAKAPGPDPKDVSVCGILGERLPIARLHDKVKFPGGQASGCQLVCMNDTSFESYGKTQSFNGSVSEEAMKKYTGAFNKLLSDRKHHCTIEGMVLIWFAIKEDDSEECSVFSAFLGNSGGDETDETIAKFMQYAGKGYTADRESIDSLLDDSSVTFYIAGLTPNSSRICQKFMYRGSFGEMLEDLMAHQSDLMINEKNARPVYFGRLAKELVSPKSSNDLVPPPLMSAIMLAALSGTRYPDALLATVVRRVKTDSDEENSPYTKLNDTRAGIIKACLNRKYKQEEITMAWNEANKDPAYLCGGLFAVYEKIQQDSSGGSLNPTIKDAYFASAAHVRPAFSRSWQSWRRTT